MPFLNFQMQLLFTISKKSCDGMVTPPEFDTFAVIDSLNSNAKSVAVIIKLSFFPSETILILERIGIVFLLSTTL